MNDDCNAKAVIETVKDLHNPVFSELEHGGMKAPFLLVPKGFELLDAKAILDEFRERPERIAGTAVAETVEGFCDIVQRRKTSASSLWAVSGERPEIIAVIDDHEPSVEGKPNTPDWCAHRVTYAFPVSPELMAWRKVGQSWKGQQAFAAWLDEHRFELADPLDLSANLGELITDVMKRSVKREEREKATPEKVFASPLSLSELVESLSARSTTRYCETRVDKFGGIRVMHEREGKVETAKEIPNLFLVEISAFVGSVKLVLPARLKAQVVDGALQLTAELIGVERVLERAFDDVIETVKERTKLTVNRGRPEKQ